jgi:hypothetical protein
MESDPVIRQPVRSRILKKMTQPTPRISPIAWKAACHCSTEPKVRAAASRKPVGAGRIDLRIVHDRNLDLIQGRRLVHGGDEGGHDAADALSLLRIERMRRGLAPARLCRLGSPGGAPPLPAQPAARRKLRMAALRCVRISGLGSEHERRDHERDTHRKRARHRFAHCRAS